MNLQLMPTRLMPTPRKMRLRHPRTAHEDSSTNRKFVECPTADQLTESPSNVPLQLNSPKVRRMSTNYVILARLMTTHHKIYIDHCSMNLHLMPTLLMPSQRKPIRLRHLRSPHEDSPTQLKIGKCQPLQQLMILNSEQTT